MTIQSIPPIMNNIHSEPERPHEKAADEPPQPEQDLRHGKPTRRYGGNSTNGHTLAGLNVRKSLRLRKIPAPYIRTSLSPEVYARAARTGMPLPVKKRPHVYNNPNNPGPDVDMEPRQESNRLRQLEAHPVLSNESRENSRNNPTDTDDMDETPDPIGPGNADSRVELPQIYANRWIPNQAARTSDLKDRYGGCWFCRIKHHKCTPAGDSCTGCKDSSVKCLGRGQPPEQWMRDGGARQVYLERNSIGTHSLMRGQLPKGHPKSLNKGKSPIQRVRFLPPAEGGPSRRRSPELCASQPSWGEIDTNSPSPVLEQDSDDDSVQSTCSSEASLVFTPPPFENKPKKQAPAKWKQELKKIHIKGKTVAQFLGAIDLDHKVQMFHQLHLRSERDLQAIAENIRDLNRQEELWKLLEAKGLSIVDWWAIKTALNV